jgi:hypothetical protein
VFGGLALAILFAPTGSITWGVGVVALIAAHTVIVWRDRQKRG